MEPGTVHSGDLSQDSPATASHRSGVTGSAASHDVAPAARTGRQFYHTLSGSSAGLELGLSVVVCVLLGMWLDGKLGTEPWLMLACLALGLTSGFRSVLREVRRSDRRAAAEAPRVRRSGSEDPKGSLYSEAGHG
jgi:ATP synthase protein I